MMRTSDQPKSHAQLIWGAALIVVGVAVFFRIPQVMPRLAQMGQTATTILIVKTCFYLMGIMLVGGGIRKILQYIRPGQSDDQQHSPGHNESDR